MFEIVKYTEMYEDEVMDVIRREGEDWKVYWEEPNASKYRKCLRQSVTYVALADGKVCGYSRSLPDALFIYVCDLLVNKEFRGNGLGEKLMRCLQQDYPDLPVYIMSGNDEYYKTISCVKEGSIYALK